MIITLWALFRQSLSCQHVAAAAAATSCVDFFCSFFIFDFINRVWALFLQSLPCRHVIFTVFPYTITPTRCRRPPVLKSMLRLSWNTPLICCCAAAFHASSFDLLCFGFLKCEVCFCCYGVFSFVLCFCVTPCVMCFISFYGGGFFLLCQRFLGIFFELGHSNIDVFSVCSCSAYPIVSCFFFLFLAWISESSHDTSVVASHVDHVVGLGVLNVSQISSLSICFSFPFGETKDVCFCGVFLNIVLRAE